MVGLMIDRLAAFLKSNNLVLARKCRNCRSLVRVPVSRITDGHYCNTECRMEHSRTFLTCDWCGKSYRHENWKIRKNQNSNPKRYCGKSCRQAAYRQRRQQRDFETLVTAHYSKERQARETGAGKR